MGRISQLTEITTIDNADLLYGVDVSDLTHSPDGSSRKFTKQNLLKEINSRAGDIESDVSDLESAVANILNLVYPVGSIYISTVSTNPATLFGVGTWSAFGAGRTLVGIDAGQTEFDTVEKTGGAKTHTLSVAELASHAHKVSRGINMTGFATPYGAPISGWGLQTEGESSSGAYYRDTNTNGSGNAHNNLQPYIVTYMWKRTA